jgi:hypothetical protein
LIKIRCGRAQAVSNGHDFKKQASPPWHTRLEAVDSHPAAGPPGF